MNMKLPEIKPMSDPFASSTTVLRQAQDMSRNLDRLIEKRKLTPPKPESIAAPKPTT